jgi:hypothetical protein
MVFKLYTKTYGPLPVLLIYEKFTFAKVVPN